MLLEHSSLLGGKRIVLASQSPRRKELLAQLGIQKFDVHVSTFNEMLDKKQFKNGAEYAMQTAYHKALEVADKVPDSDLVIAADTVVEHEGIILEKPADFADACRVLASLSGHRHQVHTGVVLVLPKQRGALRVQKFSETTHVEFAPLSTALIEAYVKTGDPFDKAGSYGIQGPAGAFVRGIEGCYFNVMGLPMHRLSQEVAHLLREGLI